MAFFSLLIVLAITYKQGAARPADSDFGLITKNGSEEEFQIDSDDGIEFKIPTNIREGLVITINGTINTASKTLTMVLLSSRDGEKCRFKFNFEDETIYVTPALTFDESTPYTLIFESGYAPTFSLRILARVIEQDQDSLEMTFKGNGDSESAPLGCQIKNFEDINSIVMKKGVAHIDSLLFEFEENH